MFFYFESLQWVLTEGNCEANSLSSYCLPSAALTLVIQLTQKMEPQYSSKAAAHMVHTDGFSGWLDNQTPFVLCSVAGEVDSNVPSLCDVRPHSKDNHRTWLWGTLSHEVFKLKENLVTSLCREKNISTPKIYWINVKSRWVVALLESWSLSF